MADMNEIIRNLKIVYGLDDSFKVVNTKRLIGCGAITAGLLYYGLHTAKMI